MRSDNTSTLSMCIVTYLNEYLCECEFILETILDYESGDQPLMQQNHHRKSHARPPLWASFSYTDHFDYDLHCIYKAHSAVTSILCNSHPLQIYTQVQ